MEKHKRHNHEDASSGEFSSGTVVLVSEEKDEEGRSKEEWNQDDHSDEDVPPGNGVTHEAVEDLNVKAEVEDHSKESDDDD